VCHEMCENDVSIEYLETRTQSLSDHATATHPALLMVLERMPQHTDIVSSKNLLKRSVANKKRRDDLDYLATALNGTFFVEKQSGIYQTYMAKLADMRLMYLQGSSLMWGPKFATHIQEWVAWDKLVAMVWGLV
jgi:hypothetical protein